MIYCDVSISVRCIYDGMQNMILMFPFYTFHMILVSSMGFTLTNSMHLCYYRATNNFAIRGLKGVQRLVFPTHQSSNFLATIFVQYQALQARMGH